MVRWWWALVGVLAGASPAVCQGVPNPSFEAGVERPEGWLLSGGQGGWERGGKGSARCVSVSGNGEDSNAWVCQGMRFRPQHRYRVTFWARSHPDASGGTGITGSDVVNRDFGFAPDWRQYGFVLRTPQDTDSMHLRFGQWHVRGALFFDDIALDEVQAYHRRTGDLELGEGERILDGRYLFDAPLSGEGSNDSRCLHAFQAAFNSQRWVMVDGAWVIYRHQLAGRRQTNGQVTISIGYHTGGICQVQASTDGQTWRDIGTLSTVEEKLFDLPDELFPAEEVWIRLLSRSQTTGRGDTEPGDFQIHGYHYEARLDSTLPDAWGATRYVSIRQAEGAAHIELLDIGDASVSPPRPLTLRVESRHAQPFSLQIQLTLAPATGAPQRIAVPLQLLPGQQRQVSLPYTVEQAGEHHLQLAICEQQARDPIFQADTRFWVAALHLTHFGERLRQDEVAVLWWCGSTYKVSRGRPAPDTKGEAIRISAARNEYEPFQLVVRPTRDLVDLRVEVLPFRGPRGSRLEPGQVSVRQVAYVLVRHPTDSLGVADWWPDPLPLWDRALSLRAGENQPVWITVHVPEKQPAGLYRGAIRLHARDWEQEVPVELRVHHFALPARTRLQSAFGFSVGWMRQYHHLETDEEVRQVFDLYMQDFREHRLCPADPMALDPIRVEFGRGPWQGGEVVEEGAYRGKQSLKVVDSDVRGDVLALNQELVPIIPQATYHLSWVVKTARPQQPYMVTLGTFDAARQWLSGWNVDLPFTGSGEWERQSVELVGRFAPEARFVQVVLRPAWWTEAGENTGTAWFDEISLTRQPDGPNLLADPGFEETTSPFDLRLDTKAFDQAARRYLDEFGFNAFSLPLQGMGGGTFYSRYPGRLAGFTQGSPEYERLFATYARAIQDHLEKQGWLGKEYLYWFDEPDPKDYEFVREGMARIHRHAPRLTRMLTEEPVEDLFGAVDLWCPITSSYNHHVAQARRRQGERFWWYVCTGPRAPYIGLFIDHHAIEMRLWLWQTIRYGINGILVWQTNYWTSDAAYPGTWQNPWQDPMSYVSGYGTPPGTRAFWGNGDGRFLYPPCRDPLQCREKHLEGPVPSLRWEMLREGMEDAEYFHLLRDLVARAKRRHLFSQLLKAALQTARVYAQPLQVPVPKARDLNPERLEQAEALLSVPEEITRDLTHFTQDPRQLETHREAMVRAIEWLQAALD